MTLTDKDKRTIRLAAYGLAAYLLLFYGVKFVRHLEASRTEYQQLVFKAQVLKQELETYETKAMAVEKLQGDSGIDLTKIPAATLLGETGAAVQQAAQKSGVVLSAIREGSGSASAGEIGSLQMEATGPIQSVFGFLGALDQLGYPLVIESVEFSKENQPGTLKVNLDMVIIDFTAWQEQQRRNNA